MNQPTNSPPADRRISPTRRIAFGCLLLTIGALMLLLALSGRQHSTFAESKKFEQLFADLAAARDFDKLEAFAAKFRAERTRTAWGAWALEYVYEGILHGEHYANVDNERGMTELIEAWKQRYPASVTPRILEGAAISCWGYQRRGNWPVNRTAPERLQQFEEYMRRAFAHLQATERMSSADPQLYAVMLEVAKGLGLPRAELYAIFQRGARSAPGYYPLVFRMTEDLAPKWGGSSDDAVVFAAFAADAAGGSDGDIIYAKIAELALREACDDDGSYARAFSRDRVMRGFAELQRRFPGFAFNSHEEAAMALRFGDGAAARAAFSRIGLLQWDEDGKTIWYSWFRYMKNRFGA